MPRHAEIQQGRVGLPLILQMAKILQPTDESLHELCELLRFGGLVGVPTETVYGLAANAFDATACQKIFEVKQRPTYDPLICHVAGIDALDSICHVNDTAQALAKHFWPGPLTFVLPKRDCVPDIVTAGLDSVAARCSAHPDFCRLVEQCDFPLAAPSANPFAYISPTTAQHVQAGLGEKIPFILDGGPCSFGVESTILDLRDPERPRILRYGALPAEAIEAELGRPTERPAKNAANEPTQQVAPGALPKHYSPRAKLKVTRGLSPKDLDTLLKDSAALLLAKPSEPYGPNVHWLSQSGKLDEIACSLYSKMRELDDAGFESITVEEAPELGLGLAINDRLRRAAFE